MVRNLWLECFDLEYPKNKGLIGLPSKIFSQQIVYKRTIQKQAINCPKYKIG